MLPFLDIVLDNSNNKIQTSVFHKQTYTELLTNFNSFVPFQYITGLIRTLLDRTFRINSSWYSFDVDLKSLYNTLGRNLYTTWLISKIVRNYLNKQFVETENLENVEVHDMRYFKLPYIGNNSIILKNKIKNVVSKHCQGIDIKLIFTTCKLRDFFSNKDKLVSFSHASNVVYEFVCASCNASYVGETERHLSTRIREHYKDKNSHIYQHLNASVDCKRACNNSNCFSILDRASTKHQLRIKEGLHIKWKQPALNKQLYCYVGQLLI